MLGARPCRRLGLLRRGLGRVAAPSRGFLGILHPAAPRLKLLQRPVEGKALPAEDKVAILRKALREANESVNNVESLAEKAKAEKAIFEMAAAKTTTADRASFDKAAAERTANEIAATEKAGAEQAAADIEKASAAAIVAEKAKSAAEADQASAVAAVEKAKEKLVEEASAAEGIAKAVTEANEAKESQKESVDSDSSDSDSSDSESDSESDSDSDSDSDSEGKKSLAPGRTRLDQTPSTAPGPLDLSKLAAAATVRVGPHVPRITFRQGSRPDSALPPLGSLTSLAPLAPLAPLASFALEERPARFARSHIGDAEMEAINAGGAGVLFH